MTRPACYADEAADVLAHYQDQTNWHDTWVANHIFYHETKDYDRATFHLRRGRSELKDRAFAALSGSGPRGPCSDCSARPERPGPPVRRRLPEGRLPRLAPRGRAELGGPARGRE